MRADDLGQGDDRFARKAVAKGGGKIRHRGEIEAALGVKRVIDLRATIGRLAKRLGECTKVLGGLAEQVGARRGGLTGLRRQGLGGHIETMIARRE